MRRTKQQAWQAGANAGEETDRWIDEQQGALYCVHVCRVAAAQAWTRWLWLTAGSLLVL